MPGHFDSIGFVADEEEDLQPFIRRALAEGDQMEVIGAEPGWGGRYVCWSPGEGAQLWLAVNEQNEVTQIDPHFAGRGRAHITLDRSYDYDDHAPPTGGVIAWVGVGTNEETKAGFDLPAFARFYDMACDYDGNALVQVAAFTHGAEVFEDADAYFEAMEQIQPGVNFEIESFLPIGIFDESGEMPPATARFSGHVLEATRLKNPATDREFWAILVKTVGMTVDVVADDEQLSGTPRPGMILAGSFWLSALPADGPRRAGTQAINAEHPMLETDGGPKITITHIGEDDDKAGS